MRKRGALYLHWGAGRLALDRSLRSLRAVHPELPVEAVRLPDGSGLLDKAAMAGRSPFQETLFLDADTVVLDRLDFGFEMAARHGLACCVCECPWARRYGGLAGRGDLVEYSTGVIFWTAAAAHVFSEWERLARAVDSSIRMVLPGGGVGVMPENDQAAFALAVEAWGRPPFALPLNWNFRPAWHRSWWGPLKIWHDYSDPPAEVLEHQRQQLSPGAIVQYRELGPSVVRPP